MSLVAMSIDARLRCSACGAQVHRVRQRLVTARTAVINQLRGLLRERGLVIPGGRLRFERYLRERLLTGDVELSLVSRALSRPSCLVSRLSWRHSGLFF